MKLFFTSIAFWLGLAFAARPAPAQDVDTPTLLILTVSAEDHAAALLLRDLTHEPSQHLVLAEARDSARAQEVLMHSAARHAVVLDTLLRSVRVIERHGSARTRQIEGPPTPYVVAFVASELLALEPAEPPRPETGPPPPPPPAAFRVDGTLSFDASRAYTTAWVARPKLVLGFWLSKKPAPRALTLLGVEVAGPSRTRRDVGETQQLSLTRWDLALRVGAVVPFGRVRLLTFARGLLGHQRVDPPGSEREPARSSLGLGVGGVLEVGITRWFALCAGVDLGAQLRRQQFTFQGNPVLREHLLLVSASLGLVLSSPWQ